MPPTIHPLDRSDLARIEPDGRIVVLARTIHVRDPGTETALKDSAVNCARFGETCLGQALYRHRTVFRNASEAPVWSHLELSYFRGMVPGDAILDLVVKRQPAAMDLLRAEILLTTPKSFVLPRDWQGLAGQPERQASLEFIQVEPRFLGEYRDVMRDYVGPAAAKLVRAGRFGTFRAMETAAVLYHDPGLKVAGTRFTCASWKPTAFTGSAGSSRLHCAKIRRTPPTFRASSPASIAYARFPVGLSMIQSSKQTLRSRRKAGRKHDRRTTPIRRVSLAGPLRRAGPCTGCPFPGLAGLRAAGVADAGSRA